MSNVLEAFEQHKAEAQTAYAAFLGLYPSAPRVPGCSTVIRLAWRIHHGKSPQEAAAREYVYRWHLALIPSPQNAAIFGVPHTLGM